MGGACRFFVPRGHLKRHAPNFGAVLTGYAACVRTGALVAAIVGLALLWAPSASAAVFGSNGCGKSEFEPELLGLACADGKVVFEVREWTSWDATSATGVGLLKHPDLTAPGGCQRTILACPWLRAKALRPSSARRTAPQTGAGSSLACGSSPLTIQTQSYGVSIGTSAAANTPLPATSFAGSARLRRRA